MGGEEWNDATKSRRVVTIISQEWCIIFFVSNSCRVCKDPLSVYEAQGWGHIPHPLIQDGLQATGPYAIRHFEMWKLYSSKVIKFLLNQNKPLFFITKQ